jgi:hypothetical protein
MSAYAVVAGAYLPHAAPDTAGDVGAVHHDMSPEAPVLVDPDCCFFVKRRSAVETSNRNPPAENVYCLHSL